VTIGVNNLAAHNHTATFTPSRSGSNVSNAIPAVSASNDNGTPGTGVVLAKVTAGTAAAKAYSSANADTTLKPFTVAVPAGSGTVTVANTGSGQALPVTVNVPVTVDTLPPYMVLNYIIATMGVYPQRP
jgi:microcystin-dependent protein